MDASTGIANSISSNSSDGGDLKQLMEQRKRKRMISNRESARRSRLKKQQHLDELTAQVARFRKENNEMLSGLNVTSGHYTRVEAENAVLRAQAVELSHRLQSLNEIASFMSVVEVEPPPAYEMTAYEFDHGLDYNSWSCLSQPLGVTAQADTMFQC